MFTSKLAKFCYGISVAEGWHPQDLANQGAVGSASYRNHNPGNLRVSEYEVGNTGEFAVFENDIMGFAALVRQIELIATGKVPAYGDNCTIEKAMQIYTADRDPSPEFDNYLTILEQYSGAKRSDLISTIM